MNTDKLSQQKMSLEAHEQSYKRQVQAIKEQYKQRLKALEKEQEARLNALESGYKRQKESMLASMNLNRDRQQDIEVKH